MSATTQASRRLKDAVRYSLTLVGKRAPAGTAWALNAAANYVEAARRLQSLGIAIPAPVSTRFEVFEPAVADFATAREPLYLEFGVWEGETFLWWMAKVANPGAKFVGFDSFEGLPEDWNERYDQTAFDVAGQPPRTDDPRASFVKGWFDETLKDYEAPAHDRLLVNVDSDLYSSAVTVLNWAKPLLKVGDFVYFDEFYDRAHEGRAFEEFVKETGYRFEVLAGTPGLVNVLFRRVG
jgi:hypothetical protein